MFVTMTLLLFLDARDSVDSQELEFFGNFEHLCFTLLRTECALLGVGPDLSDELLVESQHRAQEHEHALLRH